MEQNQTFRLSNFTNIRRVKLAESGNAEMRAWHSLKGRITTVPHEAEQVMVDLKKGATGSLEYLARRIDLNVRTDVLNFLSTMASKENELLVRINFDEEAYLTEQRARFLENYFTAKPDRLYLFPSGACNHRCTYCYVPLVDRANAGELMKPEIHDISVDEFFAAAMKRSTVNVQIRYLGGEPLYNWPSFKRAVEATFEKAKQYAVNPLFVVLTNASLITPEMIRWFKSFQYDLAFLVSLDGVKEVHDHYRVDTSGKGTFDLVWRGFNLLREAGITAIPHMVVGTHNQGRSQEFVELLSENGIKHLSFSFLSMPSEEVKKSGATALKPLAQLQFLKDIYSSATSLSIEISGHWKQAIVHLINGDPSICRGGTRSICITAPGDVFPCQRIIWDPGSKLTIVKPGFLSEINLSNEVYKRWIMKSSLFMEKCSGCSWIGIHSGGCPPITEQKTIGDDCSFHSYALNFALSLPINKIKATNLDMIVNGMMTEDGAWHGTL